MAIGATNLKVTKTTNVVRVTGGAGNVDIDIDHSTFLVTNQTASSPTVGIKEIYWTGDVTITSVGTSTVRFDSGGVTAGHFILPVTDTTDGDENIKVTLATGSGTCILVLKKLTGYAGI
jgi:hypothetical protein|tara:strand:+ start:359 stop:715 length:357 start_codon:yes stop_codon:yes gene_type:complete